MVMENSEWTAYYWIFGESNGLRQWAEPEGIRLPNGDRC